MNTNNLITFLNTLKPGTVFEIEDFHNEYTSWCEENFLPLLPMQDFIKEIDLILSEDPTNPGILYCDRFKFIVKKNPHNKEKLQELLNSLGNSPEEIAETLKSKGIKGLRKKPCWCPISMVIWDEFRVRSSVRDIYIWINASDFSIDTPKPIRDFIRKFDSGEFEELRAQG